MDNVQTDLLLKAVGDITAALIMADKQDKIAEWTAPYVAAINEADARLAERPAVKPMELYRHAKRGTVYEVLGEAELQCAIALPVEGDLLTVYRGTDGKLWARFRDEFHDGRFEIVPRNPA